MQPCYRHVRMCFFFCRNIFLELRFGAPGPRTIRLRYDRNRILRKKKFVYGTGLQRQNLTLHVKIRKLKLAYTKPSEAIVRSWNVGRFYRHSYCGVRFSVREKTLLKCRTNLLFVKQQNHLAGLFMKRVKIQLEFYKHPSSGSNVTRVVTV